MIDVDEWIPTDGLALEPNALLAVKEQTRSLALTAGPGAGKTEMLAQRADFLLRTGSCRYPKRILAVSFKKDASRNLRERVQLRTGKFHASRFDSYTFDALALGFIRRFRPLLTGQNVLDADFSIGHPRVFRSQIEFGDLVPLALEILESSVQLRNAMRQTYSDVFLDEFQDCTSQQYRFLTHLFQGTDVRLTAVGDTKQMIMGWAGALEGNFENFARDFHAVALNMYINFRSQPKLLRMQNEIISVLDPNSVMPEDMVAGDAGLIEVQNYLSSHEEATSLVKQINQWIEVDGIPKSEIAVLVSQQAEQYAEQLMLELQSNGIPYRNEQDLQDFSVEPVVRLVLDYLLVLCGQREPEAYSRLMDQLDDSSLEEDSRDRQRAKWDVFLREEKKKLLSGEIDAIWNSVKGFMRTFGKERIMRLSPDYENKRWREELLKKTKRFIAESLAREPELSKALSPLAKDDAIRILTIHKSKGLEFDTVIILGVESQAFWGDDQNVVRCKFFVGISRAKRQLILTTANQRQRPRVAVRRWDEQRTIHSEFIGYASNC
tara:strand:+ start:221 stop:1867 length:1647 start_codon:yes stop_codon:yes gene_type:complete